MDEKGEEEGCEAAPQVKRGRGRPKGSKNKPKPVAMRPRTPKRAFMVDDDEMDVYWRKG